MTGVGIIPALIVSTIATGTLGVAESREKRNIASIGHSQEHLVKSQINAVKKLYSDNKNKLTDNAKKEIETILGLKNPNNLGSKVARGVSYVSGPVVSLFKTIYSGAKKLAQTSAFNIVFGVIAPIMPFINVAVSSISAHLRHKSIRKDSEKFEEVVNILFNSQNYDNSNEVNFESLKDAFKEEFLLGHHQKANNISDKKSIKERIKERFFKGDKKSNVTKAIALPNWLGNKIRKMIPAPEKFKTEDLTAKLLFNIDNIEEEFIKQYQEIATNLDDEEFKYSPSNSIFIADKNIVNSLIESSQEREEGSYKE